MPAPRSLSLPHARAVFALFATLLGACQCGEAGARIEADPQSLDFGTTAPTLPVERTVTLLNQGQVALQIGELTVDGEAAAHFFAKSPQSLRIEAGGNIQVAVVYAPTAQGNHSARLVVKSDAANAPELVVPLSGVATRVETLQQAYVKASNTGASDSFRVVALSADGNTLAVGAPSEASSAAGVGGNQADNSTPNSGAVYVFTRMGTDWVQQAYLKASNTGANDYFGASLALSADGSTLAVGAPSEASSATGVGGNQDDNSAPDSGAVYVFTRTGTAWTQLAYVKASNTGAGDSFGLGVELSADGNTLAVEAYFEDSSATGVDGNQADDSSTESGAAYVFARTGTAWTQQAYVKASNTEADDMFGMRFALSADGNTLAVGTTEESSSSTGVGGNQADNSAALSGAVYVFTRTGTAWAQQAYIKASNTEARDRFGDSIALSAGGNTLTVGAWGEDSGASGVGGNQDDNSVTQSGAVYVFGRAGTTWEQEAYVKASNVGATDYFGRSLALSADGSTLAVGAYAEDSSATGVGGGQADDAATDSGAVYVFTRTGMAWVQQDYVKASNAGAGDRFGTSLALSADGITLAVGAPSEDSSAAGVGGDQTDNSAADSGAVYIFTR